MDRNFLITYDVKAEGIVIPTYVWFETEEKMEEFIEKEQIDCIDKIEILSCREIE